MMRMGRKIARSLGIETSPSYVICPEHVKTIAIEADGRARIDVRETMVFLRAPHPGDLFDVCTVDGAATLESFVRQTPDANDLGRRRRNRDSVVIDWAPKNPVVPYALYDHQYSWFPPGSHSQPALCSEFHCEKRTGTFVLEMITPQAFEAAVAFPRPGWAHMRSERTLIKYALKQLEAGGEGPTIGDNGQRLEWRITGPRLSQRYMCVVFHTHGVAMWQEQLRKSTIRGKIQELMGRLAPTST
jgi:hypothetical protein